MTLSFVEPPSRFERTIPDNMLPQLFTNCKLALGCPDMSVQDLLLAIRLEQERRGTALPYDGFLYELLVEAMAGLYRKHRDDVRVLAVTGQSPNSEFCP